jgi:signal transduction histidine kinase
MLNKAFVILLIFLNSSLSMAQTWHEAQESHHAAIDILWYDSKPFIQQDVNGKMYGLEVEIIEAFRTFLNEEYQIELELKWIQPDSFIGILEMVRDAEKGNVLGISAFSITEERQKIVKYTRSYLPDITVLVSSEGTSIVESFDEINSMMEGMTAITIKGTIYEQLLINLKNQLKINFDIRYISSDDNVLDQINSHPNSFGFMDLPIYLMWMKNGSNLVRQNFFTVHGSGYGFIMPKSSDWDEPFESFMNTPKYQRQIGEIISRHIGSEIYEFIDNLKEGELLGTSILTKEKQLQQSIIERTRMKLEQEENFRSFLSVIIILILMFCILLVFAFYKIRRSNQILKDQKNRIESQQLDIRKKNEQLQTRNSKLIELNEDRKYLANILAHDLRSPLTSIIGLSNILASDNHVILEEDKHRYYHLIQSASQRMDEMISKILIKAIEESENPHITLEQVNLNGLIRELEARYNFQAHEKQINLTLNLSPVDLMLKSDHLLLSLILENLLSNAIKYSNSLTTIAICLEQKIDQVLISVADQGLGFSDKDKELLFKKHQKLSAQPTGDEHSIGLGLSIVKRYVDDLGGRIWLESELGKGSTFYLAFKYPK